MSEVASATQDQTPRVETPRYGWAQLREVFTEGAITLSDRFGGDCSESRCIALRTVLFLDGDLVCTIDARALERANFAELLAQHQDRARATFRAFHAAVERYLKWLSRGIGVLGPLSYAATRGTSDLPAREVEALLGGYLPTMYVEVLNVVLSCVAGLAITQILHGHISQRLRGAVGRPTIFRQS